MLQSQDQKKAYMYVPSRRRDSTILWDLEGGGCFLRGGRFFTSTRDLCPILFIFAYSLPFFPPFFLKKNTPTPFKKLFAHGFARNLHLDG
jgi:hypothetical protein